MYLSIQSPKWTYSSTLGQYLAATQLTSCIEFDSCPCLVSLATECGPGRQRATYNPCSNVSVGPGATATSTGPGSGGDPKEMTLSGTTFLWTEKCHVLKVPENWTGPLKRMTKAECQISKYSTDLLAPVSQQALNPANALIVSELTLERA